MPELPPAPLRIVGVSEAEPILLTGPPGRLTGRVHLQNPRAVSLVFREPTLKDPSGVLIGRASRHAVGPVVLRPAQERTVALNLAVDPATPPGDYRAEVELMGQSRPALLRVAEVFDLTIQPDTLVIENRAGRPQHKRVIVTNDGNVPFKVGDLGDVELRDDVIWERDLRLVVQPWIRQDRDADELCSALLALARERIPPVSQASVRVDGGVPVRPGETATIDLEITLRDALPATGRFRGRAALLTEDLDIVVVSSGGHSHHEAPHRPARRAALTPPATRTESTKPTRKRGGRT